MNSNKKLYNLFLILVAVSMLFVSVFGSFSVADTNTEKSEKSDDNYLLSDIPDELSDEPPFDAEAVSSAGAIGLMQIMPATGEWIAGKLDDVFDVQRLYEPSVNLRYGCWYLRFLLDRYDGDMRTASTAYHQGQGRVDEWLQDPQYSQDGRTLTAISSAVTDTYVNRIMESYEHYKELY